MLEEQDGLDLITTHLGMGPAVMEAVMEEERVKEEEEKMALKEVLEE